MPKKFNYFEASIRTLLKKYIQRGKVDLFINYEDYTEGNLCLKYNRALAAEYMDYFNRMAEEFDIQNDVKVSTLAKFPEVFSMEQVPDDEEPVSYTHLDVYKRQVISLQEHPTLRLLLKYRIGRRKEERLREAVSYTHLNPLVYSKFL